MLNIKKKTLIAIIINMNILINHEYLAKNWCDKKNLTGLHLIYKNENAIVFSTNENTIIKFTKDFSEFINCFKILGKKFKHHVTIYDMKIFHNDVLGIMMEKVDTSDIDNLFYELEIISIDKDIPIIDIDYRKEDVSRYARRMSLDIKKGISEIRTEGNLGLDINSGNIGRRKNGDFVLFDQTENLIFDDYIGLIQIEEELLNKATEHFIDVDLKKIIFCKEKISKAISEHNQFKFNNSKTIEIFINKFGEYEMISGYDFLIDSIMIGNMNFRAKLVETNHPNSKNPCILNKNLLFKEILNIDFFDEIKRIIEL